MNRSRRSRYFAETVRGLEGREESSLRRGEVRLASCTPAPSAFVPGSRGTQRLCAIAQRATIACGRGEGRYLGVHVGGAWDWGVGHGYRARSRHGRESKRRLLLALALTLVTVAPLAVLGAARQAVDTGDSFLDNVSSPHTRMTTLVRQSSVQDQFLVDWSKCRVYRDYWVGGGTCSWAAWMAQQIEGLPRLCPICDSTRSAAWRVFAAPP